MDSNGETSATRERLSPVHRRELSVPSDERQIDAGTPVGHHQVFPSEVAHPVGVDLGIVTGLDPDDLVLLRPDLDVAAVRASGTDSRRRVHVPGAGLEQIVLVNQGSHRADVYDVAPKLVVQVLPRKSVDVGLVPSLRDD
ncbi:MAG: hypothetical protein P8049_04095, partial [Gemmatimonadota bacterium]